MATKRTAKRTTRSTGNRNAPQARAAVTRGMPTPAQGTEEDLKRLVDSARRAFQQLRAIEDEVPESRKEKYFRDRAFAREAFESAEIAAFQNLVEQQRAQLPVVTASLAQLADDMQATASVIGVLNLASAGIGVLASVVALFA